MARGPCALACSWNVRPRSMDNAPCLELASRTVHCTCPSLRQATPQFPSTCPLLGNVSKQLNRIDDFGGAASAIGLRVLQRKVLVDALMLVGGDGSVCGAELRDRRCGEQSPESCPIYVFDYVAACASTNETVERCGMYCRYTARGCTLHQLQPPQCALRLQPVTTGGGGRWRPALTAFGARAGRQGGCMREVCSQVLTRHIISPIPLKWEDPIRSGAAHLQPAWIRAETCGLSSRPSFQLPVRSTQA